MTKDEFRAKLQARIDRTKDVTAFCFEKRINRSHLYEFLAGKPSRGPSPAMLDALGMEYRIVRKRAS